MKNIPFASTNSPLKPNLVEINSDERKNAKKSRNMSSFRPRKNLLTNLQKRGFTQKDLPLAIIFHEFLGIIMLTLTWTLCYYIPLSQQPIFQKPIQKMTSIMPKSISNGFSNNEFISSRLGVAYLESSCVRKIIRPFTLPAKVLLTYKFLEIKSLRKTNDKPPIKDSISSR